MSDIGNRMKGQYENRTRYYLPRRTYTIIRLDGKCFHGLDLDKPFDDEFIQIMDDISERLCQKIQGAQFAYAQSDEISLLLTDFENENTEAWFDNNLQKMCSVSASFASSWFTNQWGEPQFFDSRAFTIPDPVEVENYFIWRQMDAIRNSISMVAQHYFSHDQLHGKACREMRRMLKREHDLDWSSYFTKREKHGGITVERKTNKYVEEIDETVEATEWTCFGSSRFTEDRQSLRSRIPRHV